MVNDRTVSLVVDGVTGATGTETQVDVFVPVDEHRVEPSEVREHLGTDR